MKTVEVIKTNTERLLDGKMGSYLFFEDDGSYLPASDDYEVSAKALGVTPELVEAIEDALQLLVSNVADMVGQDLTDIWKIVE